MNNKQFYKETFDIVQMSEESIRRVKNMSENNEITNSRRRKLRTGFRAAVAAAALAAVFAISNVAVYAATGSSLVDKVGKRISVYINGEKSDVDRITKKTDENGNGYYEIKLDDEKENSAEIMVTEDMPDNTDISIHAKTDITAAVLEKTGKKIYLVIGDNEKRLDITKAYKDGRAEGSFDYKGDTYHYTVSGTVEKHHIDIEKE